MNETESSPIHPLAISVHRFEMIDLGSYRGADYFLVGVVEPEPTEDGAFDPDEDADSYGVVLVRATSHLQEPNVEVVRLDTAHGQQPHLDRVYLRPGADSPQQVDLGPEFTYQRMRRYLLAHWTWFADRELRYNG